MIMIIMINAALRSTDKQVLASVLNSSSARCWSSEVYNPYPGVVEAAPSSRGFNGGFAMSLMEKDLHLALQVCVRFDDSTRFHHVPKPSIPS